jgi:hypothetical protein
METQYIISPVLVATTMPKFNYSTKEVDPRDGVGPYDILSYTIVCSNSGDMDATSVKIKDTLSTYLCIDTLISQQEIISGKKVVDIHGNWNQFDSGMVDGKIIIKTNHGTYTSKEINFANYPNILSLIREINISPAKVTLEYDQLQDRFILKCRDDGWLIALQETGLLPFFSEINIPVGTYCTHNAVYNPITRELIWDIGNLPVGSSTILKFKSQVLPGIGTITNEAIVYWGTGIDAGEYRIGPVYTNVDITPPITGTAPIEGIDVDIDADTDGSYYVSWLPWQDMESGIVMYELQESTDRTHWTTLSSNISADKLKYLVSNRSIGETYYYRLRAKNYAGYWSNFSSPSDGVKIVNSFGIKEVGAKLTVTKGRLKVDIPKEAFPGTITFTIHYINSFEKGQYGPNRYTFIFEDSIVELSALPEIYYGRKTQPVVPITLTIPYNDPDIFNEIEDYTYRVFKLTDNGWEIVTGDQYVDPENDTITVTDTFISTYAVGKVGQIGTTITVKPNPFRADKGHKYIWFSGIGAQADIWIYNTAGELVYHGSNTEQHIWDTKNNNGMPVASGMYIYVIKDMFGNYKTGEIGIIR